MAKGKTQETQATWLGAIRYHDKPKHEMPDAVAGTGAFKFTFPLEGSVAGRHVSFWISTDDPKPLADAARALLDEETVDRIICHGLARYGNSRKAAIGQALALAGDVEIQDGREDGDIGAALAAAMLGNAEVWHTPRKMTPEEKRAADEAHNAEVLQRVASGELAAEEGVKLLR